MNELNFKSESIAEIEKVITTYFDLLYKGDKDLIETVFLPEANVSSLSNGKIVQIDMDGFRKRIAERQSPESVGEMRDDKIISIDNKIAKNMRERVIESLMISHPHDCPVCEEGGECHLQDMTLMSGHN